MIVTDHRDKNREVFHRIIRLVRKMLLKIFKLFLNRDFVFAEKFKGFQRPANRDKFKDFRARATEGSFGGFGARNNRGSLSAFSDEYFDHRRNEREKTGVNGVREAWSSSPNRLEW